MQSAIFQNDLLLMRKVELARVLKLSPSSNMAWLITLQAPLALPREYPLDVLRRQVEEGSIELATHKTPAPPRAEPTPHERRKMASRLNIIAPLITHEDIFNTERRHALILERAAQVPCSQTTIYKNLRKWWQGGQVEDALRDAKSDTAETGKPATTRRRGRIPAKSIYEAPYQLLEGDIANIKHVVKTYYLKGEISTLRSAYDRLIDDYYRYLDGEGLSAPLPIGRRPTYRQFRYHAKKLFSLSQKLIGKLGEKQFKKDKAPRLSTIYVWSAHVGEVYEIDATVGDILLVARSNRARIIGKPTIYLIYDRKSRFCVGFLVTLEPASWAGAMEAMLTIGQDWEALCLRHKVPYHSGDWPSAGLYPTSFVGDRGEMASESSNQIASGLRSTITNTPALAPQGKGTVELGFKTIQRSLAAHAPAYVPPSDFGRRRGPKYEKDASLTLDEMTELILRAVIAHNHRVMPDYPLRPDEIDRGVPPTPCALYKDGIACGSASLIRYSQEVLRLQLLPRGVGTVTDSGIQFKNCTYVFPSRESREPFVLASSKGRFKVNVLYDPRLCDQILVADLLGAGTYTTAKLSDRSDGYKSLSFAEVAALLEKARLQLEEERRYSDIADHRMRVGVRATSTEAKRKMQLDSDGASRSARRADTKEDRTDEARARRYENPLLPSVDCATDEPPEVMPEPGEPLVKQPSASTAPPGADSPMSLSSLLRSKRKERMKNGR